MTNSEIEQFRVSGTPVRRPNEPGAGERRQLIESESGCPSRGNFWYSRRQALAIVLALLALVRVYSDITPPFQSPDEFNHVKRAYLLSKGVFFATVTEGVVGGEIDTGLMTYLKCFGNIPLNYGNKLERTTVRECNAMRFSGKATFSALPNTAEYFPLLYSPQAVALFIGRIAGLTVATSYYLARLFSQLASLSLVLFAMSIFPFPPAVLALLLLPMNLFQFAAASLDAMSFATAIAISALFMKAYRPKQPFGVGMSATVSIGILLLSLARIVYIALAPLLLVMYYRRKSPSYIVYFAAVVSIWCCWMLYLRTTILPEAMLGGNGEQAGGTWATLLMAWSFCKMAFRTLISPEVVGGYLQSFIGVLGASDTPLSLFAYTVLGVGTLAVLILTLEGGIRRFLDEGGVMLGLAGLATLPLVLFAAFQWTPPDATTIDGVQGRYFYPTAFFLFYSVGGAYLSKTRITACVAVISLIAFSSIELSIPALLDRYWAAEYADSQSVNQS